MTLIEGDKGVIVVDTLNDERWNGPTLAFRL
jgi:alkyl sulfatase BDS1-like metallo-beta-lactamase superfamily hydrolase